MGFKVKNSIVQNEKYDIKSENNEILIKTDKGISKLLIGYFLPKPNDKEYTMIINYKNKDQER